MTGSSVSFETSGIPAAPFVSVPVVAPLSLSIPTTEMTTTTGLQSPFSLMDDIMDELAGTTPDTPQPSRSNDLSDFGLAFELSRQLDINASEAKTSTGRPGNGVQKIVGKLEQNSVFKDNAFLQQARSGAGVGGGSMTPTPPVSGGASHRSTLNNSSTAHGNQQSTTGTTAAATGTATTTNANAPSYLAGRFRTIKEAEEEEKAQAAAARLREASKKANAQLPSDDEGSDVSSEDDSDDEQRVFKKQQRLLAQQQHQHQLFLQQQAILQNELAGTKGGVMSNDEVEVAKPVVINHEAVIDRMKDRHRALLQGAHHHATREEYYEDFRDEYPMQQQRTISPGGSGDGAAVMAYGMPYGGMDPSMMYADDYRLQQQQMYYPQGGIPGHPHVNAANYNHPSVMNGMAPGYGYAHLPASMPSYTSGMQTPVYHHNQYVQGSGGRGTPTSVMSHHIMQQQQFQLGGRSNSVVSDGSSLPNSSSRRGSVQHSVVSSARVSEDSWNDASQQLQHQHHHHQLQHSMSALSTQKTANSDSGYSGVASDQGKHTSFDDSLEDIQTAVGSEYEKTSSTGTKSKVDDVAKVIEVLSISQAVAAEKDSDGDDEDDQASDDDKSEGSDSDSERDEDPESLKGSTMINSIRRGHSGFKSGITTRSSSSPSAATSNIGSNEPENENDNDSSDDDDQPIILSRRNSARGPFLPASIAAASASIKGSAEEVLMMSGLQAMQQVPVPTSNGQMQYMPAMNMYQQQPMHMSYMPPQQPQPQQQSQLQQQAYIPMGYQFPGPQPGPMVPHHQHSYSVDRAMLPPSMVAQGPIARRVNPSGASKGHTSTGSSGSSIQSQYPIPATTLLHPGPRRSQSVRVRPQTTSPINSNTNPAAAQSNGQPGRGRSSIDFVRLPSSGYQSMISGPINGPDFTASGNGTGPYLHGYTEPLSPPSLHPQQTQQQGLPPHLQQHHQQQMEKQQLQQGYFMSGPMANQYGYMMQTGVGVGVGMGVGVGGDPYSAHPHQQQILQAGRR
ncbi:hypothetical protein BKA57DRAFT_539983 [Linnemannia elongata]|nr:hypothetical protein BKA57DRAFT_539983 [Linnemannia elongata]